LILSTGIEPELNFKIQNVDCIDRDRARGSFGGPRLNLELPGFIWDLLPKLVSFPHWIQLIYDWNLPDELQGLFA
jgi:hypothetical protein